MIRRSYEASEINVVLNDPSVKPWVARPETETIDATPIVNDPRNVLLMAEGGGLLFCQQEPAIYEVHTNFLEGFRGANAIRAARDACRWMFLHTDAMILQTRVPAFNSRAEQLARLVGGTKEFERPNAWVSADGTVSDVSFWTLRYEGWVCRQPAFQKTGAWFHHKLDEELAQRGIKEPNHGGDPAHDLYVGACVEMVRAAQPDKAVVLYNRVAAFAGFGPIVLLSHNPLILDIGTAIIHVIGDDFRVVKFKMV